MYNCLLYTSIQTVTDAIRYVGVDDNTLALFENQYPVQPMGVSYNSYVKMCIRDSDSVNRMNPNGHTGMIYCSNL